MKSEKIKRLWSVLIIGLFISGILLILQPLFADGPALHVDADQAGGWAMFFRNGGIGVTGVWLSAMLLPQKKARLLPMIAALILIGMVIWEITVALEQLYGDEVSNHALYHFTGTFLNPGPFSGFIAMGLPLAVHYLVGNNKRQATSMGQRAIRLLSAVTVSLCLLLLPAGMSRSAWIAAAGGSGFVVVMHRWKEVKEWCKRLLGNRKRQVGCITIIMIAATTGWGVFHLKEDSAHGRLMMWKIACHAIAERPWMGYGSEGFPAAYAEAQERYFATGKGTENEIYVAGTTDNAFNEYLTITVKYGLPGLIILLGAGITAVVCSIHLRAYGIAGALITIAIFAFSSYPFQLPDFLSAIVVLVVVPIVTCCKLHTTKRLSYITLFSLSIFLYWSAKRAEVWQIRHKAAQEWRLVRTLYNMDAFATTCEDYAPLYEQMKWNSNFLFEYGRALHQTGQYEESNRIMEETERLCGDPMILNIQGKNHQAMGHFDQAALIYRRAFNRLPSRIYPLYLEMEMYASPECNRPEAAKKIAKEIISMKEKVPSQAIREMKTRAKEILNRTSSQ